MPDHLWAGHWPDDLVGIASAAALFLDQIQFRQFLESRRDPFLAYTQLPRQFLLGENNKDLAAVVDPAIPAEELETIEQKGVYYYSRT